LLLFKDCGALKGRRYAIQKKGAKKGKSQSPHPYTPKGAAPNALPATDPRGEKKDGALKGRRYTIQKKGAKKGKSQNPHP
jgi:hypothetical protein